MKKGLIAVGIIIIIVGIYLWSTYNRLISADEAISNQWAQVETQYQRRFDLIPNLVESVKGVMSQEQKIFSELAEARTRYSGASGADKKAEAAGAVEGTMARLLVIMENYPELKSSEAVQTLMVQLEGTENRISVERKRYNDSVRDFNVMIKRIPAKWIAFSMGFSQRNYFQSTEGSENAPKVDLQNK
jgi:LemA protein